MKAFITGVTGQDGAYLADLLLKKGFRVHGGVRFDSDFKNLEYFGIRDKIQYHIIDFKIPGLIEHFIKVNNDFDYFFNLAGMSSVAESFENEIRCMNINGLAVYRILESLRKYSKKTKFLQASSSEIFGNSKYPNIVTAYLSGDEVLSREMFLDEQSDKNPVNPYGVSKLFAHNVVRYFRENCGMFASTAILFNHESSLRGDKFVTKKIINYVKYFRDFIKFDLYINADRLYLGNIYINRDFGFAGDYVEGMSKVLEHDKPDDFIFASQNKLTIRDFVTLAFHEIGITISWEGEGVDTVGKYKGFDLIRIDPDLYRPNEITDFVVSTEKAKEVLNWESKTNIKELIKLMLDSKI